MAGPAPPLNTEDSAPRQEAQGAYLRIQSVTIFVRDLDRSVRFYVDQLGFNLVFDARNQTVRPWVAVAPPDGSATLMLCEPEPGSAECKLIGRATQVAFVTEDVVAKFREWRRRGVEFLSTPRLRRLRPRVNSGGERLSESGTRPHLGRNLHPFQGSGREFLFARELRRGEPGN